MYNANEHNNAHAHVSWPHVDHGDFLFDQAFNVLYH